MAHLDEVWAISYINSISSKNSIKRISSLSLAKLPMLLINVSIKMNHPDCSMTTNRRRDWKDPFANATVDFNTLISSHMLEWHLIMDPCWDTDHRFFSLSKHRYRIHNTTLLLGPSQATLRLSLSKMKSQTVP